MATVTATITVDFTANYAGNHRVCFRIQGSGDPYDCSTIVNCVGGATACQAIINTPVNTTSCDGTVTFEGYIQATCEDILSVGGRLAWTADFVPNPTCLRQEILCARGPISSIVIDTPGQEYLITDTLTIVRDGGDPETGDGDIEIATVGTGVINSVTGIAAPGTLYTALDVLTVVDTGGSGAGATIRVDTVDGGGGILTFTLLTNGTDYIGGFTFTGGTGSGADFTIDSLGVDYDIFGTILTLSIITPGNYGVTPTITITPGGGGNGGALIAAIGDCGDYLAIGSDCIGGDTVNVTPGLSLGQIFAVCIDGAVAAAPAEYDVTQTGCCIAADSDTDVCFDYHIENTTGGAVVVQYTGCGGDDLTVTVDPAETNTVCAILNGVNDPNIAGVIVTNTGTPCT